MTAGMKHNPELINRAVELCSQINALSEWTDRQNKKQQKLIVSFDIYCVLLEYTVYLQQTGGAGGTVLEDFLLYDDLMYEAGDRPLDVRIDFFLSPNTLFIE